MSIHRQIVDEWESWERLILDDLKRIDRRIQKFYSATTHYSCSREKREEFVRERLCGLVVQSTNKQLGEGKAE